LASKSNHVPARTRSEIADGRGLKVDGRHGTLNLPISLKKLKANWPALHNGEIQPRRALKRTKRGTGGVTFRNWHPPVVGCNDGLCPLELSF